MGRRFGDRLERQERFRRGVLCVTFGVVLPISVAYAFLSRRIVEVPARAWILSLRGKRVFGDRRERAVPAVVDSPS